MIETDLGCVTAYADAVAQGYTGTREEFGQVLANFADSATQVECLWVKIPWITKFSLFIEQC